MTRRKFAATPPFAVGAPGIAAAVAAAISLTLVAPVSAGEKAPDTAAAHSAPIVVHSQKAMEQWQADTTRDLNRALTRDPVARKVHPNNSIVEVAFRLGNDGKPENVRVVDGNGNWAARRAAKHAVRTLGTLGSVPIATPEGTRFLASIIFADTMEMHDKLAAKAAGSRAMRFAASDGEDQPILIGG